MAFPGRFRQIDFQTGSTDMALDTVLNAAALPPKLQAGLVALKSQLQTEQAAVQLVARAAEQAPQAAPEAGRGNKLDISV